MHSLSEESYMNRFNEIYNLLTDYQGDELYNKLSSRLDMQQYFRKMGMDYLLMNGDYTDEIYFYSTVLQGDIQFMIIPWDYDDIFQNHPHEVGVSWGIGKIFGNRSYPTQQDIYDEIGDKLIFSIEDDLDYVIAKDSLLYLAYEGVFTALINELNSSIFEDLFYTIKQELTPYYADPEIVAQSRFDADSTNLELWRANLEHKQMLLEERLVQIKNQLNRR